MIYANHAATSWPKVPAVITAVTEALDQCPVEAERSGSMNARDIRGECRQALATLFHAPEPKRIALTAGATHALNLVLEGLLRGASHIVTTMTEHNSVLRPLYRIEKEVGTEITYVPCDADGRINAERMVAELHDNTRAVILNHTSNVTGIIQDLRPIAMACRERGIIFVVDASQSAGYVPIDVQSESIDILVFAGHKGIGGPPGTGGAVFATDLDLRPLMVGGTGIFSSQREHPHDYPFRYEAGTPNTCGIAGLTAAVRDCLNVGVENIFTRLRGFTDLLFASLSGIEGLRLIGGTAQARLPVQSLVVDRVSVSELGYLLQELFGVICRAGLHCSPQIHSCLGTLPEGTLRLSLGRTNTINDVDGIVSALSEICKSLRR